VIAVGKALVDSLLEVIMMNVVSALFNPTTSLLMRELHIPVLTWLYDKFFGEPLTILNVVTLVAATPVTILYKVATGHWLSKTLARMLSEDSLQRVREERRHRLIPQSHHPRQRDTDRRCSASERGRDGHCGPGCRQGLTIMNQGSECNIDIKEPVDEPEEPETGS
jgi:hypothetical protein